MFDLVHIIVALSVVVTTMVWLYQRKLVVNKLVVDAAVPTTADTTADVTVPTAVDTAVPTTADTTDEKMFEQTEVESDDDVTEEQQKAFDARIDQMMKDNWYIIGMMISLKLYQNSVTKLGSVTHPNALVDGILDAADVYSAARFAQFIKIADQAVHAAVNKKKFDIADQFMMMNIKINREQIVDKSDPEINAWLRKWSFNVVG